jgi:LysM repeat protein
MPPIPSSEIVPSTPPPTFELPPDIFNPVCATQVQPGDTLTIIAERTSVSVADIISENSIANPDDIKAFDPLDVCRDGIDDLVTGLPRVAPTTLPPVPTTAPMPETTAAPVTTLPPAPATIDNIPGCSSDNLTDECQDLAYDTLRQAGYTNSDPVLRVRAYQANNLDIYGNPLEIDSQLGPLTFGALDADPDLMTEAHINDGRIANGGIVSLDTQIQYVYNDGAFIGAYAVTTGIDDRWVEYADPQSGEKNNVDARTNTGNFQIFREVDGWKRSSDFQKLTDDPVMFETAYYDGGEANHGVPAHMISRTAEKLSKGCVRIPEQDMIADANGNSVDAMIEVGDSFIIEGYRPELPPKPVTNV